MKLELALTFDDILLTPAYSEVHPEETDISVDLVEGMSLRKPFLSSPMDTVTESRMAAAVAREGGMGVIHRNMTIEDQVHEVRKVKKCENWMVTDPITVNPNCNIQDVSSIMKDKGYSGIPVVDSDGQLLGIVTNRDVRFATTLNAPVSSVMTSKDLVTIPENIKPDDALKLFRDRKIEKLIAVNKDYKCVGLITVKDIERLRKYPDSTKDDMGRLRVGAAVGVNNTAIERTEALLDVGVDIIFVDTAHGHAQTVIKTVSELRKKFPNLPLAAGNVVTVDAAKALAEAGANCVKVGVGPGSICTTRVVAGVGMPQASAIANVSGFAREFRKTGRHITVIADGGMRSSGDAAKAIALGADIIMSGFLFAGSMETPGEISMLRGRAYKVYRGMGSLSAMRRGSADRYMQTKMKSPIPEGVEGHVPLRGSISDILKQLTGGLRLSMGYTGNRNIKEMQEKCSFVQMTSSGLKESHAHDVNLVCDSVQSDYKEDN